MPRYPGLGARDPRSLSSSPAAAVTKYPSFNSSTMPLEMISSDVAIPKPVLSDCTKGTLPMRVYGACYDQPLTVTRFHRKPFGTFDLGKFIAAKHNLKCMDPEKVPVPIEAPATVGGKMVENRHGILVEAKVEGSAVRAFRDQQVACCDPKKYHIATMFGSRDAHCSDGFMKEGSPAVLGVPANSSGQMDSYTCSLDVADLEEASGAFADDAADAADAAQDAGAALATDDGAAFAAIDSEHLL